MSRSEMVKAVGLRVGLTQKVVNEVLAAYAAEIAGQLQAGNSVRMQSIGTLRVTHQAAKIGRIINGARAGEKVAVPARNKVKFRPLSCLLALVNE